MARRHVRHDLSRLLTNVNLGNSMGAGYGNEQVDDLQDAVEDDLVEGARRPTHAFNDEELWLPIPANIDLPRCHNGRDVARFLCRIVVYLRSAYAERTSHGEKKNPPKLTSFDSKVKTQPAQAAGFDQWMGKFFRSP